MMLLTHSVSQFCFIVGNQLGCSSFVICFIILFGKVKTFLPLQHVKTDGGLLGRGQKQ